MEAHDMSDFLHEPKDELRSLVDDYFLNQTKKEPTLKGPTRQLKLPKAISVSKDKEAELLPIARKEVERVRQMFLDFQDEISDTAIYPYLYPHIEQFAEIAQSLSDVLENSIDEDELSKSGLTDYGKLQDVRNRILNQIDKRYNS
jgi:hypothetical protein